MGRGYRAALFGRRVVQNSLQGRARAWRTASESKKTRRQQNSCRIKRQCLNYLLFAVTSFMCLLTGMRSGLFLGRLCGLNSRPSGCRKKGAIYSRFYEVETIFPIRHQ